MSLGGWQSTYIAFCVVNNCCVVLSHFLLTAMTDDASVGKDEFSEGRDVKSCDFFLIGGRLSSSYLRRYRFVPFLHLHQNLPIRHPLLHKVSRISCSSLAAEAFAAPPKND